MILILLILDAMCISIWIICFADNGIPPKYLWFFSFIPFIAGVEMYGAGGGAREIFYTVSLVIDALPLVLCVLALGGGGSNGNE